MLLYHRKFGYQEIQQPHSDLTEILFEDHSCEVRFKEALLVSLGQEIKKGTVQFLFLYILNAYWHPSLHASLSMVGPDMHNALEHFGCSLDYF